VGFRGWGVRQQLGRAGRQRYVDVLPSLLGLRQAEVSQRVGIERTRLAKWESGRLELTA
jgi:hypothetical protein